MRLSSLCLCTLICAPAVLAQRLPEVEPNNTPATAQAIAIGTQIDANLAAGEDDWYSFTVSAYTRVRLQTSNTDTRMALLNSTGTTYLGIDDDARTTTNGFSSEIMLNIAAGTYTVQIVGFTSTTAGPYSMEIAQFAPLVYTGTEIEPNDTHLTATPTTLSPGGARYLGNVGPATLQLSDLVAAPTVLSDSVPATAIVFSGSVVSSTTTVITTAGLVASAYTGGGFSVQMTSGVHIGLIRLISANTATTITTAAWPSAPAASDTFDIITTNSTTVTRATAALVASAYVPSHNLVMTSGANIGLARLISANTTSTITTAAFPVANSPSDTFDIVAINATGLIRATAALPAGAWTPATTGFGRFYVRFTSGANAGQSRQISSNTATSISCSAFSAAPLVGDAFVVELCDVDYYQVVLTAPASGLWFQINDGDAPWVWGHRYECYDSAGALIASATLGTQAANCSTLVARTSSARVWPAGTYYIAVRSPNTAFAAASVMPNGLVPLGNYMLELFHMPMDTGATVVEVEPNNTVGTATPLAPGAIGQGNITNSTGADPRDIWGPIVISTPSTITYQTRQGAATALMDSTINLLTDTGAIALTSLTGNILSPTSHARATVTFFLAPGTFFLEVLSPGAGATQAGNYELELSSVIPASYVAASYATLASNGVPCGTTAVLSSSIPASSVAVSSSVPATSTAFSGSVVSSTTTVITTSGLVSGAYAGGGYSVQMTSGAQNGLIRPISANTATTITTTAWPAAPAASDTYNIINTNSTTVTWSSAALVASAYSGGTFFIQMTSGANNGLARLISANTTNTVTAAAFPVANAPTDTFIIGTNSTTVTTSSAPLVASAYVGGAFSLQMTSGVNAGLSRLISANTTSLITHAAFPAVNAASDTFSIARSPILTRQWVSEVPTLGNTFSRQVVGCPANGPYIWVLGFSNTLGSGSVVLPFDFTGLGAPGCTLNVDPVFINVGMTDVAGAADLITVLPSAVVFRGFVVWEQVI
ncbi:MAG TPA: pre-peptidase C-terminal domain-containing protein, partial [Planctomycetota bacterium]|nr:pre-peptidase C-terminal domain-containing protein [Planctomycetota bacterium]